MKVLALALVTASGVVGCSARRPAAESPVDLTIAPIGATPATAIQSTGERAQGGCTLRLVASSIEKSSPGCYLDEHISEGGTLHYPCAGDGPAEADFGPHRYTGRLDRGEIELELTTELDWEDNCRWGTRAKITGSVTAGGEPTLKRLTWSYQDHVIRGSDCSGVCQAKTSIAVSSTKPRKSAPAVPSGGDDDED
mgnify:CR=1 FL=1